MHIGFIKGKSLACIRIAECFITEIIDKRLSTDLYDHGHFLSNFVHIRMSVDPTFYAP